jgi:hypothetical protein
MLFSVRSSQKYFRANIRPRKPRSQMKMSKTTNLRRRAKINLVGTIGTTHKTNFPGHFIAQIREIFRSTRQIATTRHRSAHRDRRS